MAEQELGYQSLQSILRTRFRESIISGTYGPGQRLNINELARELGVSAVPIREALRALEAEGFVEFSANRGAVVKAISAAEVREAFLIRVPLESLAVSEAIPQLTEAHFIELNGYLDRMEAEKDVSRWLELNQRFHLSLYRCANLPRLYQVITLLWAMTRPYLAIFAARGQDLAKDQVDHRGLIEACRSGESKKAVKIIEKHLSDTRDTILAAIGEGARQKQIKRGRKTPEKSFSV